MERNDVSYVNWFYHVPGIGRKKLGRMLGMSEGMRTEHVGVSETKKDGESSLWTVDGRIEQKAEEIYRLSDTMLRTYLMETCLFSERVAETIANNIAQLKRKVSPEVLQEKLNKNKIIFMTRDAKLYPEHLKHIPDAPIGLYVKGNERSIEKVKNTFVPSVAIVGARDCSEYGKRVAVELGKCAAQTGLTVVSGLALGVDGIVQKSALRTDGNVAAVLGSGVDVCYPAENQDVYEELLQKGCIYSEYVPGTQPRANYFPPRNRIISGLADAVIVVEAREKSGTLITVDMALEQGKDVYIIPGRLTDPMSKGCNQLIRQGAAIVCDISEMFTEISAKKQCSKKINNEKTYAGNTNTGNTEQTDNSRGLHNPYEENTLRHAIWKILDIQPQSVQQIYENLQYSPKPDISALQTELFYMQMEGGICESGGRYLIK